MTRGLLNGTRAGLLLGLLLCCAPVAAYADGQPANTPWSSADGTWNHAALPSLFEAPSPASHQARFTLWNLAITVPGDGVSTADDNRALAVIDDELAFTQLQQSWALQRLVGAIQGEANTKAAMALPGLQRARSRAGTLPDELVPDGWVSEEELPVLARYSFYASPVLDQLGVIHDPDAAVIHPAEYIVTKTFLPDPAQVITAPQALLVLALADTDTRQRVWARWQRALQTLPVELVLRDAPAQSIRLPALEQALGINEAKASPGTFNPLQQAIIAGFIGSAVPRVNALLGALDSSKASRLEDHGDGPVLQKITLQRALYDWLAGHAGIPLTAFADQRGSYDGRPIDTLLIGKASAVALREHIDEANRVERQLLRALDDDLEQAYVRPLWRRLRTRLTKQGFSALADRREALFQDPGMGLNDPATFKFWPVTSVGEPVYTITPMFDPAGQVLHLRFSAGQPLPDEPDALAPDTASLADETVTFGDRELHVLSRYTPDPEFPLLEGQSQDSPVLQKILVIGQYGLYPTLESLIKTLAPPYVVVLSNPALRPELQLPTPPPQPGLTVLPLSYPRSST